MPSFFSCGIRTSKRCIYFPHDSKMSTLCLLQHNHGWRQRWAVGASKNCLIIWKCTLSSLGSCVVVTNMSILRTGSDTRHNIRALRQWESEAWNGLQQCKIHRYAPTELQDNQWGNSLQTHSKHSWPHKLCVLLPTSWLQGDSIM